MFDEIPPAAALQEEIHDGSCFSHPEWRELVGASPIGNSYEGQFAELFHLFLLGEDQSPVSHGHGSDRLVRLRPSQVSSYAVETNQLLPAALAVSSPPAVTVILQSWNQHTNTNYMDVAIDADHLHKTGTSIGAHLKASNNLTWTQRPRASVAVPSGAAITGRTVMARLLHIAWSGTLSVTAAIFTTVIDWTVIGWRDFWLTVCIAAFVTFLVSVGQLVGDLGAPELHEPGNL